MYISSQNAKKQIYLALFRVNVKFRSIKILKLRLKIDWKVPSESQVRSHQSERPFLAVEPFLLSTQGALLFSCDLSLVCALSKHISLARLQDEHKFMAFYSEEFPPGAQSWPCGERASP